MIDYIFYLCVDILVWLAKATGTTYELVNILIFIILSFAIHCFASYFSVGFYSQDEHFQILSPVEFLLGINDNLSKEIWEFGDDYRIRPWFQSFIYFYIIYIIF